jgi:SEC-C motif-containing protein
VPNASGHLILDPEQLAEVPVYKLLEAAAAGYLAIDHRFLHAIIDDPSRAIPDLVRYAAEDHSDSPIVLAGELLDIFRYFRTPEAIPFLLGLAREDPEGMPDDLVEAFVELAAASVEPLLQLWHELDQAEKPIGEVPFTLAVLNVRDPRILDALINLARQEPDTVLYLDMYGDPAAIPALNEILAALPPDHVERFRIQSIIGTLSSHSEPSAEPIKPFDLWDIYPPKEPPPVHVLDDAGRLALLEAQSAELRIAVIAYFRRDPIPDKIRARLLQLAKSDPDSTVRGEAWETLGEIANEPEIRKAMLAVLNAADAPPEEKAGIAIALSFQPGETNVHQVIEELYAIPSTRAKALKAMAHSFDRRFAAYPPKHLDDPDPKIRRQAIWGVGYLMLNSEVSRLVPIFREDEFRSDAIFAYALAVPGETSRSRVRSILRKVDAVAGGLTSDEYDLVEVALDQRLMLHGHEPVFTGIGDESADDETPEKEMPPPKPGRNDPCPCGSGKKYKKCCGA